MRDLHPTPTRRPGMEFRTSLSWFNPKDSKRVFKAIPFVSKSGKFSLHTLYVWKAYPEQVFMSVISTVYFRLLKIFRKRYKYVSRRDYNNLIKISIVYVITKNNWFIDRFLGMSRKETSRRAVTNFVHYVVNELDENKRFVYSQAFSQANWLKFQVFRPSDKSREITSHGTHLQALLSDVTGLGDLKASSAIKNSMDFWKVEDRVKSFSKGAHYLRSLESFDDMSELVNRIAGSPEDSDDDYF